MEKKSLKLIEGVDFNNLKSLDFTDPEVKRKFAIVAALSLISADVSSGRENTSLEYQLKNFAQYIETIKSQIPN